MSARTHTLMNLLGEYISPSEVLHVGATSKELMSLVQSSFKGALEQGRLLWDVQQCLNKIHEAIKEHEGDTTIMIIHVGNTSVAAAMVNSVEFIKEDGVSKLTLVPETIYIVRNLGADIRKSFRCNAALIDWLSKNAHILYTNGRIDKIRIVHQ